MATVNGFSGKAGNSPGKSKIGINEVESAALPRNKRPHEPSQSF
jgi:hypothetical protein